MKARRESLTKEELRERIGIPLVIVREKYGITQRTLAKAANLSYSTIGHLECGLQQPTASSIGYILKGLKELTGQQHTAADIWPNEFDYGNQPPAREDA